MRISAQGGAYACDPTVLLDNFTAGAAAPSTTSHAVTIAIYWQSETGDADAACGLKHHTYTTSGVVGQN